MERLKLSYPQPFKGEWLVDMLTSVLPACLTLGIKESNAITVWIKMNTRKSFHSYKDRVICRNENNLKNCQNKQLHMWQTKLINCLFSFCKFWPRKNCSFMVQATKPWQQGMFSCWKSLLWNIIKSLILKSLMIQNNLKPLIIFKLFLPSWVFHFKTEIFH